jgi:soluble lytic murein transglycosylase-like protein
MPRKSPSRGRIDKEFMKISIVLAAALAAGLTTFAANAAQENPPQVTKISLNPDREIATTPGNQEKSEDVRKEDANKPRGLTSEEVLHAAEAFKADKADLAYKAIVERYASLNGVPVSLAHAVIKVESNYRPYSRGRAGEVGLMQIKPATAKLMGYSGSITGLFDPETNIKFGMKYLGKARRLSNGTTCGTILKYNAGHAARRMNPVSRDYCSKVKRHLEQSTTPVEARRTDHWGV